MYNETDDSWKIWCLIKLAHKRACGRIIHSAAYRYNIYMTEESSNDKSSMRFTEHHIWEASGASAK